MAEILKVDNPATGEIEVELPLLEGAEIAGLVARSAAAQRDWAQVPLAERIALVERFMTAFEADRERIAQDITRQMGKPIGQARGEIGGTLGRVRGMLDIVEESLRADEIPEGDSGLIRRITHEPVGVVLDIAAWNYPLLIAVNVIVPSVLAGNSVLVKHSGRTPLCADHFVDAFKAAGAPEDLILPVNASHAVTAQLIERPEVGYVSFTGSVRGGHEVYATVSRRFIDATFELGGKDPAYVRADADFDNAVENLVDGAFYNTGQSCCAIERIYVDASIYERFVEAYVARVKADYALLSPSDENASIGALAQAGSGEFLAGQVEEAVAKGATLHCGGKMAQVDGRGRYFEPAVLSGGTHEMQLMVEESFGPVIGIAKVDSESEAIALMNDSPYGLTASVWTQDLDAAARIGAQVQTGTFFANRCDYLDPQLAWTGVKDTGKGCSLSRYGFHAVTRLKSWHFRRSS